jgi:hypothetical protein
MSGFDRRDAAYTQARETLIRRIDDEGISRFPDDERAAEIRRMIAELREQHPDLDDQLARQLMGEALRRDPDPYAGRDRGADLPDTGV